VLGLEAWFHGSGTIDDSREVGRTIGRFLEGFSRRQIARADTSAEGCAICFVERELQPARKRFCRDAMTIHTQINRGISAVSERAVGSVDIPAPRTPQELAVVVHAFASSVQWLDRVRLRADRRWYECLYHGPEYDVWLISWMPGQSTGFHDHGASSGALLVTTGTLEEHRPGEPSRVISAGDVRAFGPDYAHDVRNSSKTPSISIHAYSPPLTEMNRYELEEDRLIPRMIEAPEFAARDGHQGINKPGHEAWIRALSIDEMLAAARARLQRLSPKDAFEAMATNKAVLVDIRPASQRALEGYIPGALVVERNVLEWRFDPTSESRLPGVTSHDLQIIVFCSEGYTSSLAAVALQELGLWRATDMVGGIKAWREEGLPMFETTLAT
jgi:rhodanese-related sulfurtransferase/quercetin dioxygenase-like cupin family protein